jgi:hypothetical protein
VEAFDNASTIYRDQTEDIVPNNSSIVACVSGAAENYLPSGCLAIDVSSGSTIPVFRHHVTIISGEE